MRRRNAKKQMTSTKRRMAGAVLMVLFSMSLMGAALKTTEQSGCFPLKETAGYCISDRYGKRQDPITGQEELHAGVDLACAEGTAVLAALDGFVTTAKYSTSYGNYIVLCHADGLETLYAHLQYLYVRAGEVVWAGQQIGTAGQTGRATGAHLHFELCRQGERCDPLPFLGIRE